MSFYVRVFSQVEDFPSLYVICDELLEEGFEFATSPGKDEPEFKESNWRNMVFQYDESSKSIELDRDTKGQGDSVFEEEQEEFLESVKKLPYSKGQKKALEIVKDGMQIYAFEVDEEGIYDKDGELLVEME